MERMEMNRAGSSNKGLEWMRKIEVERDEKCKRFGIWKYRACGRDKEVDMEEESGRSMRGVVPNCWVCACMSCVGELGDFDFGTDLGRRVRCWCRMGKGNGTLVFQNCWSRAERPAPEIA